MASSMTALSPDKALSYSEQKLYDDFADERRRKQQRIAEITEMIHVHPVTHITMIVRWPSFEYVCRTSSLSETLRSMFLKSRLTSELHGIQVASLLHDDVLDHADTRRGIGSLNSIMGNKVRDYVHFLEDTVFILNLTVSGFLA